MQLFVGLGNPGQQYQMNRHNIGFMAVDEIANANSFGPWRSKFHGLFCEGRLGNQKIVILKPSTFMNLSGQSVGELARFYKINSKSIMEIKTLKDKSPVTVAVYITSIDIKTSKKNSNKYAYVNFEDSTGIWEGIVFNDEILKYEPQLELGIPLLVSGYIENSDENIKLIVNSVNGNEAIKEIKNKYPDIKIKTIIFS